MFTLTVTLTHSHLHTNTHITQMLKTQFFQILKIASFLCSFNRARLPGVTDRRHRRLRPHCPPPDPHHHLRRQGRQVLLLQRLRLESPPQEEGLQEHRQRKVRIGCPRFERCFVFFESVFVLNRIFSHSSWKSRQMLLMMMVPKLVFAVFLILIYCWL